MKQLHLVVALAGAVVVSSLAAASQAQAQPADKGNFYLSGRLGAVFQENADNGSGLGGNTVFDPGPSIGAAFGYRFGKGNDLGFPQIDNVRVEFEFLYQQNDVHGFTDPVTATGGFGDANNQSFLLAYMVNFLYDYQTNTRWTPYVGAGVGAARYDLEATSGGKTVVDDNDTVLAYQAMAGVAYALTPSTSISLGYRFFDTEDPRLTAADGTEFDTAYRTHTAEVGLTVSF